ncbi:LLM class flavin-dependent oxidoreductase [Streptomyces sp. 4N124]|uniref:LLM class flavin-dependent oxidoreductase n=1 Tax=Streptomyces sp. 4N124 TaxID=3457420 RepID=UPI003FD68839
MCWWRHRPNRGDDLEPGILSLSDLQTDPTTNVLQDPGRRTREIVSYAVAADPAGLDLFGLGEHHSWDFAVANPAVLLAAIAQATTRIRLADAGSVLPPGYGPAAPGLRPGPRSPDSKEPPLSSVSALASAWSRRKPSPGTAAQSRSSATTWNASWEHATMTVLRLTALISVGAPLGLAGVLLRSRTQGATPLLSTISRSR